MRAICAYPCRMNKSNLIFAALVINGILAAIVLTGCATPVERNWLPGEYRASQECRYEAEIATAGMRNVIEMAFARNDLRSRCMELKGY